MLTSSNIATARALASYIARNYEHKIGDHKPAALRAAAIDLARKVSTDTGLPIEPAAALGFIFGEREWLGMACNGFAGSGENSRQAGAYRDYFAERYAAHAEKPRTAAEKLAANGIYPNYAGLYKIYDAAAQCFKAYDSAAAALKAFNA